MPCSRSFHRGSTSSQSLRNRKLHNTNKTGSGGETCRFHAPKKEENMDYPQIIKGDYVFTPIKNAFNKKTAYWVSKKGYAIALYAFTVYGKSDMKDLADNSCLASYIRYFKSRGEGDCREAM